MLPYQPNCDSLPPPAAGAPVDCVLPVSAAAAGIIFSSVASTRFCLEAGDAFAMTNFRGGCFGFGVLVGVGRGFGFTGLGVTFTFGAAVGLGEDVGLADGFGTGS